MDKKNLIKLLKESKKTLIKDKDVEKVILFGSQATGKAGKRSDVDLIVVSRKFKNMRRGRSVGLHKYFDIGIPVDFLCYTPEEFRSKAKGITIVKQALKEGVEI